MDAMNYEIIEHLGTFSDSEGEWCKELNIIRWNENAARYDLRAWNAKHDRMSKGITLSQYELRKLKELLNSLDV